MATSIQAAQAVADIRAGMAVGEDPEFDSLVRAGERGARGGSAEGDGFAGEEGGEGGQNGGGHEGQQSRQAAPAMPPAGPDADPLTDLRGPSAYAPAPPLPTGFTEFPVAPRGARGRSARQGMGGTGMAITAVQVPGVLRAETGAMPPAASGNVQGRPSGWPDNAQMRSGIGFGEMRFSGFAPFGTANRQGPMDGVHPDPMERFAEERRRRRSGLDLLFERFEGMQAQPSRQRAAQGMAIPVKGTAGLRHDAVSRN